MFGKKEQRKKKIIFGTFIQIQILKLGEVPPQINLAKIPIMQIPQYAYHITYKLKELDHLSPYNF